jgi:hypothetical protein
MHKRSRYCLECATSAKAFDDSMVMPRRYMAATTSSFTVGHIISMGSKLNAAPELPEGCRRLGWFVLPPFQRQAVWTLEQKKRFIESVWLELPIGSYAYNYPNEFQHRTTHWLIDGQQRVTAILEYVAGEFEVFGHRYPDLVQPEQFQFENHVFAAIVTHETDEARLAEIYDRLAYGGTPHDPKEPA